jgi:hypothetical protein
LALVLALERLIMRRAGTGGGATYATLEGAHAPFFGLGVNVGTRERRGAVRLISKSRKQSDLNQDEVDS